MFLLLLGYGKSLSAQADSTDLTLFTASAAGKMGTYLDIPVKVRNFQDVISLQASFHIEDTSVARLDSVFAFGLPALGQANFNQQPAQNFLTFVWTEPQVSPLQLPDDSTLFMLRVFLKGSAGSSTRFVIDGTPTDLLVGYFNGGNLSGDSVYVVPGTIDILQNTSAEAEASKPFFTIFQPQAGNLSIRFDMEGYGKLHFSLWDLEGKKVWESKRNGLPGRNHFQFTLPGLSPGAYCFQLRKQKEKDLIPAWILLH